MQQDAVRYSIAAQKDRIFGKYKKNFRRCIGTGRMALAMRQNYMDNLRTVQREIGFEYIRGHGLFCDDMGVYREQIQTGGHTSLCLDAPLFNFGRIICVYENFLSVGIRPFVELGFMPEQMAAGHHSVFWWRGNITEPKDMNLWKTLVLRFLQAMTDHFGIDEVKKWYFEVWNEPNIGFWEPASGDRETEYFHLYRETARAIKDFCGDLRVGGPATQEQGIDWISRFIRNCRVQNVSLDFISHHIYTGFRREFSGEFASMQLAGTRESLQKFARIRNLAKDSQDGPIPLHITEWNTSYSCIDPIHDSNLNAACIAYLLAHADAYADSWAYWVFSDVFEEADVPRALFHGGFGLLTENGIRKPVFHAFAFAGRLYENIVHLDEVSCVTMDESGNAAALLFNPSLGNKPEERAGMQALSIEISIPCAYEEVFVSIRKVDAVRGNAFAAWKKMGRPRWPERDRMEILQSAQHPEIENRKIKCESGHARITTELPVNGIQLVLMRKVRREENDYHGLVDLIRRQKEYGLSEE